MVENSVEKKVKVKVTDFFELSNVPASSWVEINGKNEFKITRNPTDGISTLSVEENYVCRNHYDCFSASLTPVYIEKYLKATGRAQEFLKMMNGDNN